MIWTIYNYLEKRSSKEWKWACYEYPLPSTTDYVRGYIKFHIKQYKNKNKLNYDLIKDTLIIILGGILSIISWMILKK